MDTALLEQFALADDRAGVVRKLIPGTEAHSFLQVLLHQQRGELDEARRLLDERSNQGTFRQQLLLRQKILEATGPSARGWSALASDELFRHRCQLPGKTPPLPTRLAGPPASPVSLARKALGGPGHVAALSPRGLDRLLDEPELPQAVRRKALERVELPYHPRLLDHVVDDLGAKAAKGFGNLALHRKLTRAQLDALAERVPEVIQSTAFIDVYLAHLKADPEGPEGDEARIDQQLEFLSRLPPNFAVYRALCLFQRIGLRWRRGVADRDGLRRYLEATAPASGEAKARESLAAHGHDEGLLVAVLRACLRQEPDAFKGLLAASFLRRQLAEAMLLGGAPDVEVWAAHLDPSALRALQERVELELSPTNPALLGADDDVVLHVDAKNVDALLVRVFQIDAVSLYRARGADVDIDLDLDGFVPNHERRVPLEAPPVERRRVAVPIPEASGPGIYVIDLVGGGLSCRALLRKGQLHALSRLGAAGHVLTLVDERRRPVRGATVWLGDRAFEADDDGEVTLPFTSAPGDRAVLLQKGALTSLQTISLQGESYHLSASFHVEEEDLLPGAEARLLIRASLSAAGGAASLSLLENLRLTVVATREGVTSERVYDRLSPGDQGEMLVSFTAPEGLEDLRFTLAGELLDTAARRVAVSAAGGVHRDGFRATHKITALHLLDEPDGWSLLVLGRAGEPIAGAHVSVQLFHRLSSQPEKETLQSDEAGVVRLGVLDGFVRLRATLLEGGEQRSWPLRRFACDYPRTLHLRAGEPLRLPVDEAPDGGAAALLLGDDELFFRDLSDKVRVAAGVLSVEGLPEGNYRLLVPHEERSIRLRVSGGPRVAGWLASPLGWLGPTPRVPPSLRASVGDGMLRLRVEGASPGARVHLFATTLAHSLPALPGRQAAEAPVRRFERAPNLHASARALGDEARYILARRHAPRRAGNMLPRPALLLNPWAVSETTASRERLRDGDRLKGSARRSEACYDSMEMERGLGGGDDEQRPDLDFLARPPLVLADLAPDAAGQIEIPLAALEGRGVVRALLLDGDASVSRQIAVAPAALRRRELRVRSRLDPETTYALRGEVTTLATGDRLPLGDARYRAYDSLDKAWALLESLDPAGRCTRFDFLRSWHALDDASKQKHYSEGACHELNFFLSRKDRPFFDRVIRPYLASKRHLTFLDRYLLGHDLSSYRALSALDDLNALERILLAERLGELADEHRAQADLLASRGDDHAAEERLFRAALQADALSDGPIETLSLEEEAGPPARIRSEESGAGRGGGGRPAAARKRAAPKMAKRDAERDEDESDDDDDMEEEEASEAQEKREMAKDATRRAASRPLFRPLDATREYAEQHYRGQRVRTKGAVIAPINPFWRDYAAHLLRGGGGAFLSPHFARCTDGSAAMLLALAVLDLPLDAAPPAVSRDEAGGSLLEARGPTIVFHEQIKPALHGGAQALLVAQHYLRPDDQGNPQPVLGELLVGQPYTCQVIVSNPSPAERSVDLLLHLPEGSLPLGGARVTHRERMRLPPYGTQTTEYAFYFPHPGAFRHHPAQASEDGLALASAPGRVLDVARTASTIDHGAWSHLSQAGSDDEVIAALETRNLHSLQLDLIAWRLHDRSFYDRAMAVLERRRHHDATLWAYSLKHRDLPRAAEYLLRTVQGLDQMPLAVEAPWLRLDPEERGIHEHLEYAPLVNPRAHGAAGDRKILNDRLQSQVERALYHLCAKASLTDEDRLAWVYYLLLQDRVDEAAALFSRIDAGKVREVIQHDYLRAYLAFFDDPAEARAVASRYVEHPVDRWRDRFREVLSQLDEIEGHVAVPTDPQDRDQRQAHLASTAPSLEFLPGSPRLQYRNTPRCEICFYEMDLELLFSQRPFGLQSFRERPPMRPNHAATIDLPPGETVHDVEIPQALSGKPLLIEATSGEARATMAHTAGALSVQVIEAYGQLRVVHAPTGAPLPRVYVKVYAQDPSGQVRFHKDGYSDLRGRFDYASVSGAGAAPPRRFALLLLGDAHGAALREVNAPTR